MATSLYVDDLAQSYLANFTVMIKRKIHVNVDTFVENSNNIGSKTKCVHLCVLLHYRAVIKFWKFWS